MTIIHIVITYIFKLNLKKYYYQLLIKLQSCNKQTISKPELRNYKIFIMQKSGNN
jgi:hypothetical protein